MYMRGCVHVYTQPCVYPQAHIFFFINSLSPQLIIFAAFRRIKWRHLANILQDDHFRQSAKTTPLIALMYRRWHLVN